MKRIKMSTLARVEQSIERIKAMDYTDDIEGLEKLKAKCDVFTQDIFDWVTLLGRVDFLHAVYGFAADVERKMEALKETSKGDE